MRKDQQQPKINKAALGIFDKLFDEVLNRKSEVVNGRIIPINQRKSGIIFENSKGKPIQAFTVTQDGKIRDATTN